MMTFKTRLLIPATAMMMVAGVAQANSLSLDRVDEVLEHASNFGFTHVEEIEAKSGNTIEIEGWLDEEWYADARLSLETGESLKEERERLVTGAWGMSEADVRQALEVARAEGMVDVEEIKIDKQGMIEIEGMDENGRELEVEVRQGSDTAHRVEHD
ncbi:PepSY domain-containing protein [Halomonas urumqiensis]|uniref:PepSY domain-containing protein n=1 Tax=Halomonas urumqiensis TaxID=1684789 RepID=A0A2N7UFG5_9GAMM|nr:PepSY domain-containing protein [Halomonas urumqiensis]PMR79177.1 hypothetical protein C1H70_12810 [Halomonas urumqiensis]PTB03852.1 PepSY domain-containing protein [Halomonas urumqiensis]GHE19912.1 hypothetical protein GCM10017767_04330 [Halomonas urumqiensis]